MLVSTLISFIIKILSMHKLIAMIHKIFVMKNIHLWYECIAINATFQTKIKFHTIFIFFYEKRSGKSPKRIIFSINEWMQWHGRLPWWSGDNIEKGLKPVMESNEVVDKRVSVSIWFSDPMPSVRFQKFI